MNIEIYKLKHGGGQTKPVDLVSHVCDITQTQAPPTIVDWHRHFTLDPPWVSCYQSTIVLTPEQV